VKIFESGAVYDSRDNIIGFRCDTCNRVFGSMLGDTCTACIAAKKRHRELITTLKAIAISAYPKKGGTI
jgi:hypothetical protein